MNPKSHGGPTTTTIHPDPSSLFIPAVSEALLELRLLWRLDAFWHGGVSICRHIPSPSTSSWSL